MEVPLAAIGSQDVVDIDLESADLRPGIGRGAHDSLVQNSGGVDLIAGPGSSLPDPAAARRARRPNNAVGRGPLTHPDTSVDPGALNPKNRVDSAKPLQRGVIPRVAIDVLIDGEE